MLIWQGTHESRKISVTGCIVVEKDPVLRAPQIRRLSLNVLLTRTFQNVDVELSVDAQYYISGDGVRSSSSRRVIVFQWPSYSSEAPMRLKSLRMTQYLVALNLLKFAQCLSCRFPKFNPTLHDDTLFQLPVPVKIAKYNTQEIAKPRDSQLMK